MPRCRSSCASATRRCRATGCSASSRAGRSAAAPSGIYLDGGYGVGKTHPLASLWHAAPGPSCSPPSWAPPLLAGGYRKKCQRAVSRLVPLVREGYSLA
ncbi:MAG: hypothetical protein ACR2HA_08405 [Nocardioides sp.]